MLGERFERTEGGSMGMKFFSRLPLLLPELRYNANG
jgi:hypothetical protein